MERNISNHLTIAAVMNEWAVSIRFDHKESAESIHKELKNHINAFDVETLITYYLLESHHYLTRRDTEHSMLSLENAKEYAIHFNDTHRYFLHLAEGIFFYDKRDYQSALLYFEKAENYIEQLEDPVWIGEFHLRKAMTFYFLDVTNLSVLHAARAAKEFSSSDSLEFLLARTEMLQGANHMDQLNYEPAEAFLLKALATFKKIGNQNYLSSANLNLGVLYTERDLPAAAIPYLNAALQGKQDRIKLKILYLLADCYWKTNQPSKAMEIYKEGFRISIEEDNMIKKWEFAMLHKKHEDRLNFESVWQEGIDYFHHVEDFYNVRVFSKELAHYYTEKKEYELALKYYLLTLK
ncbi:response regulator aspartate phosphatase C [Terribacillus halophilus]|uniref:Response regulator aspartate phosphatase C n=1 Tax=Terribacillus halophilus TaxID=361279 RepID=A0A1G6L7Q8_9BACI|nr:tetratricopeptide repeat protein [Terribacillus halophilus]SDC39310.1 response regulator aspartate phosphatase C [Terribacillus halophilus]